ncbi:MAG: hypothetical protein P8N23_01200 [Methylophilaceae bacterium]|nr:hypothetical protein [Methylophilaceae bacterium]
MEGDLKTVYSHKAVNVNVFRLISDRNKVNEWVLIDPFDPQVIKSLSRLYVKAEDIAKLDGGISVNKSELLNTNVEKIGRREIQHEVILAVISALNYQPLEIPDGGKSKIKAICLTRPKLFTDAAFDHAWKEGCSKGLFKMDNSEKYSHL